MDLKLKAYINSHDEGGCKSEGNILTVILTLQKLEKKQINLRELYMDYGLFFCPFKREGER